jgi:hypothetical protein
MAEKNGAANRSSVAAAVAMAFFASVAIAPANESTLRVGAAKVDVTNVSALPPATTKYDHERANVRAIVLDNGAARAALISVPGSEFDWPSISKQVASELNCPPEYIVVSATHAHSYRAPRSQPQPSPDPLTLAVMDAVHQAKGTLQPALMGFGTGKSYLNVNRDTIDPETRKWTQYSNPDAPSDNTVAVLMFVKPTGEPIAVYVNYSMHPINAYALDVTSGDFPEAMSRYVEKAFGDNVIVAFSLGAAGDQNPLYLRPSTNAMASRSGNKISGYEMNREAAEGPLRVLNQAGKPVITKPADPRVLDELFRFIESEGQILGEEVIRVMTWTKKTTGEVRIGGAQKVAACPGRRRTNGDKMDPNTREGIEGVYVDAPPVEIPIGVLGIGTVALAAIGEEPYSLIGQKAKMEAPLTNTVVVSLANARGNTGYIPDDASFGHLTFQVLNSALKPGCAETSIVNAIQELESQYLNKR